MKKKIEVLVEKACISSNSMRVACKHMVLYFEKSTFFENILKNVSLFVENGEVL